ncbi:Arm DNA-binding domain-containing protein [Novosphingobium resinovorum]|uniref:Arm DNA-binding domain-containing protein n=1 Tax=Novosphingobium resinovorum TaxID=158500 RepID=UPI001E653985|nr:Arm DNA-binding domain-containing protein [Novosphingobium resinovorum]
MGKLSATAVRNATKPSRLGDGDGLFLIIQPGGSKNWGCRVQKHGTRRDFGVGSAAKVSLAQARERAREIRSWGSSASTPFSNRVRLTACLPSRMPLPRP